jgi:hypothetical protein
MKIVADEAEALSGGPLCFCGIAGPSEEDRPRRRAGPARHRVRIAKRSGAIGGDPRPRRGANGDEAARQHALSEARRLFTQIGATGWVRRLDETELTPVA